MLRMRQIDLVRIILGTAATKNIRGKSAALCMVLVFAGRKNLIVLAFLSQNTGEGFARFPIAIVVMMKVQSS